MNNGLQPTRPLGTSTSGRLALPTSVGGTVDFLPGLPVNQVQVTLVCLTANNGFLPGEEVPLAGNTRNSSATTEPGLTVRWSPTRVRVTRNASGVDVFTGTVWSSSITNTDWALRIRCA